MSYNVPDLEIYNGEPTDDFSVFWWLALSPHYARVDESKDRNDPPVILHRNHRGEPVAHGWSQIEIFPAFVERLRALALVLTFDGSELQAQYEWSKGWVVDGPIKISSTT